ncbi:MAG: trifunctional serine/threonine-protein kinase/ATP-binding protein/SpoIIE family protein phosphatase, partial [Desulfobacterales bacterium]|nr:trifunctional serine/threonine-protein kinase/ATP-binding protein/SpoIIE family protein phosphatase [Desulfobacterales bacterium]
MLSFPGYTMTTQLYEGTNSLIWRAVRDKDKLPVILKLLKKEYPLPDDISRFKWEHTILSKLDSEGVIRAIGLERHQNLQALAIEDFGGQALSLMIPEVSGNLEHFFSIACQLADILGYIHRREIIHKDINPSNIIRHPETGVVKLIDFGISTVLPRESLAGLSLNALEGTLAYMSPEQTGRMNRGMDFRTDLYSLGVTFYELLTGRVPFEGDNPLEMVHCHIARPPILPSRLNPGIPDILSDIVLKLMAKTPEDRYQSAHGLKADLEKCKDAWSESRQIPTFTIGEQDKFYGLRIPQKLYGRETEVQTLIRSFETAVDGDSQMLLITGYSGIGKSALVNEIRGPITRRRAYFSTGKYDQYQRSVPFSAIINALRSLIKQCLTQSDDDIAAWKDKILHKIGNNGQILVDVIPELELITGPQSPVPELGPTESQNRFNMVFRNFISVFADRAHPLVLFLDDLQWVDPASLDLIKTLITDPDSKNFMLVGAYRDHEVDESHPLSVSLHEIEKLRPVNRLTLAPLAQADINRLVCESVFHDADTVTPLAEVITEKTGGNPFFINEFLKTLFRKHLLRTDDNGDWQWDIHRIRDEHITDNVVDLLAGQIMDLPQDTQDVLKLAACIGNEVDLATLTQTSTRSKADTIQALWKAVQAGLLVSSTDFDRIRELSVNDPEAFENIDLGTARFRHDRIHQAAYSLIDDSDKHPLHLKIGWLMLENTPPEKLSQQIFDITGQLNKGIDLITVPDQRLKLAELNAEAGARAQKGTAYTMAAEHFSHVAQLLGDAGWDANYDLMFNAQLSLAEVLYLSGDFQGAEDLYQILSDHAASAMDKVRVLSVQMVQYHLQGRLQDALNAQLSGLSLLGLDIPSDNDADLEGFLGAELGRVPELLGDRSFEDLVDAPEMTDEAAKAMMNILSVMWITVYVFGDKPNLMAWVCAKMTTLSLEHGNSELSAMAYVNYGLLVSAFLGDYDLGYQSGRMALSLSERYDNLVIRCQVYCIFYNLVNHWKQPIQNRLDEYRKAYDYGMQSGEFCYASYALIFLVLHQFVTGSRPLEELLEDTLKYDRIIRKISPSSLPYSDPVVGQLLNLRGKTKDLTSLDWEHFDETTHKETHSDNPLTMCWWYCAKLETLYLYEHHEEALSLWQQAEGIAATRPGQVVIPQIYFFTSLNLLKCYPVADESDREAYLNQVDAFLEKMKVWVGACDANHSHKILLIEAEKARVTGDNDLASERYDQAIASAENSGFVNNAAIANECAAHFWLAQGKEKFAGLYMTEAWYKFRQWGAVAKADDLEAKYPALLSKPVAMTRERTTSTAMTTMTRDNAHMTLDLNSVLKASRAISQEIVFDTLLEKMIRTLVENAGAEKGIILLNENGELNIAAADDIRESSEYSFLPEKDEDNLPLSLISYVARTKENIVIDNAAEQGRFTEDPYIDVFRPKSVLCAPILSKGELSGIFYLENNLTVGAFTPDRLELLKILAAQTAVSLENARLYQDLEQYNQTLEERVSERTEELHQALEKVEISNRKVTDSISYARRIQTSLLPNPEDFSLFFNDHFVLWQPRDLVGGDIYNIEHMENGVLVAAMDCTGHGVPGAFVSMIASSLLKRLVRSSSPGDPAKLLAQLNREVRSSLGRDRDQTIADDGLDAAVCFIDLEERSLTFAGAGLPLIYSDEGELHRIRGDRQSIGYQSSDPDYVYTNHRLPIEEGFQFYLATDGFWDQLGGDKGLRFGMQRFMTLLQTSQTMPMAE